MAAIPSACGYLLSLSTAGQITLTPSLQPASAGR